MSTINPAALQKEAAVTTCHLCLPPVIGYRAPDAERKEVVGTDICLPCLSAGATDSRFLRRVGMPAYGISLMAPDFDQVLRQTVHGRNERIDIKSLELQVRFLHSLGAKYLCAETSSP